jgi:hypothetical protein
MNRLTALVLLASLPVLGACGSNDLGSGVNTVDREFARQAPDVWSASVKGVEAMDLRILNDPHDSFGGEIVAARADGDKVHVRVKSLDANRTQVSVRVEPGDRALANLLHEKIAGKLGLGEARSGLLGGGDTEEGTYVTDLPLALLFARRACRALEVTVTDDETHADWARIDGRRTDSTPVRIRVDLADELKVHVLFICGNVKTGDNKAFVHRMKEEFEIAGKLDGSGS